jgi:quinol-cytochrome oxidoreductase complex cytochrome b subunit
MDKDLVRRYLDYFLPREVLGPVVLVFALENIIDIIFSTSVPDSHRFVGWIVIFILSIILIAYWGGVDEDMEDFEEELEDGGMI